MPLKKDNSRFLDDFDPETSTRERRKLTRKLYATGKTTKKMHDSKGHTERGDLCDCLYEKCPGCHFPCPKCSSSKCGVDCRVNRKWSYDTVEIEGAATQ